MSHALVSHGNLTTHETTPPPPPVVIEWDPLAARHYLQDTGESCTVINNIPLSRNAGIKHELMEGDQIQVGGTVIRYRRRNNSDEESSPST